MSLAEPGILFFGTPDIAVPFLRACAEHARVVGVVTAPDRPRGRGRQVEAPPVKVAASDLGVAVYQPVSCRDPGLHDTVADLKPDVIVAVAYGHLIPASFFAQARLALNVHFSLLPQLRGAAPVQRALEWGFSAAGVTIQLLAPKLDAGDVVRQEALPIRRTDDAVGLMDRAVAVGAAMLARVLDDWVAGRVPERAAQAHGLATVAPKWSPHAAALRWHMPARRLAGVIRAAADSGGAHCFVSGARSKVWRSREIWPILSLGPARDGEVWMTPDAGLLVRAGAGALLVVEGQREGRRRSRGNDLLSSLGARPGDVFTDKPEPA